MESREESNVQVVIKEYSLVEATLALVDEGEQFLVTNPQTRPRDDQMKPVLEENVSLRDELAEVRAELAQEQEAAEALRAKCQGARWRRAQTCLVR